MVYYNHKREREARWAPKAKATEGPEGLPPKQKGDKEMKDHIQRARCFKGYARRDVTNKQARSRVKNEDRKALKREDN